MSPSTLTLQGCSEGPTSIARTARRFRLFMTQGQFRKYPASIIAAPDKHIHCTQNQKCRCLLDARKPARL
jgi:hypothetical protein